MPDQLLLERRWAKLARCSSVPYLGCLMATLMMGAWANYLSGPPIRSEAILIKAQSLGIVIPLIGIPLAAALWLLYEGQRTRGRGIQAFLGGIVVVWLTQMIITLSHGDLVNHVVWLTLLVVAMLWVKTPTVEDCWSVIVLFAWLASAILLATRLLEIIGAIPIYPLAPELIEYEKERFWLPLSGYLGLEGRWPGPFGYSSKTSLIGTLLIIIGLARWSWRSYIFVPVGVVTLLLTGARNGFLALAAGLLILLLFSQLRVVQRVSFKLRLSAIGVAVVALGLAFYFSPLSTSGRLGDDGIWGRFITLWETSPILGVGQTGILAYPPTARWMEGHNLVIQILTRFGLIGAIAQITVIAIGIVLAIAAARQSRAWPLALMAAYLTASLTEVFQDGWLQFSTYTLLMTVATLACGIPLSSIGRRPNGTQALNAPSVL